MHAFEGRFDGELTRDTLRCRISGAVRAFVLACLLVVLCAGPAAAAANLAGDAGAHTQGQSVDGIARAAEDYLEQRIAGTERRLVPQAGRLDPRLDLPRCDRPLEGFLPPGAEVDSRTVVGVRCSGSRPWKVYVPVNVTEPRPVLVAVRALPRDHVLSAEDLVTEERDVSRLLGGYVADARRLVGRRLKRPVTSGSVLTPSMIEEQTLVQRGQSVTLVARSGGFNVAMAGVALADGVQGERIRVRNVTSDRVVEGLVRSAQQVEVLVR